MKLSSRVVLLSLSTFLTANAFVIQPAANKLVVGPSTQVNKFTLFAEQQEESTTTDESTSTDESTGSEETTEEATEEEEETPPEDPEVTALKEEIANLESELRAKQSNLNSVQENAERYTEAGYARRVAQMEDMKRIRLSMQSSNKDTAKAGVVQSFLPVLEQMEGLKDKFEGDEFGLKYSGLLLAMKTAFSDLGAQEFAVKEGDDVNPQRMQVVEEEYNDQLSKGTVIKPLSTGYELSGNVMQLAKVVASLGSETPEEEASSKDEEEGSDASESD